ncbi:MAG TPA: hypothetical protein VGP68_02410 [Gemmataceae bacterium]|jgi:hypothetical protein|nr:hypothetical protein [Gemmataceae bacterium]
MSRLFLIGLLCLAGCRGVVGPFQQRDPERVDDPRIPISEQQQRGRDRLALPVETSTMPATGINPPSMMGR